MVTFYLHGAPGCPAELRAFAPSGLQAVARNRFIDRPELPFDRYINHLSDAIRAEAGRSDIRLIGFSLGARVALEIARRLDNAVASVELVSPAGPLEFGNFLPKMRGRAVFRVASRGPVLLAGLTRLQAAAFRAAPTRVLDLLTAGSAGEDASLCSESGFTSTLLEGLHHSLGSGSQGYRRELLAYVQPWGAVLREVNAPVRVWQGSLDDWTPPDMAQALHAALPNALPVRLLDGMSHYSTLRSALTVIETELR